MYRTNCWICEGWTDHDFTWNIFKNGKVEEMAFVHLDFDEYRPHLMEIIRKNDGDYYSFLKMCPAFKKIYYFFTIDGKYD